MNLRATPLALALGLGLAAPLSAWAQWQSPIEAPTRLGLHLANWLNQIQAPGAEPAASQPYPAGLVWSLPELEQEQARLQRQLLSDLQRAAFATSSSLASPALAAWVESLPVRGRGLLAHTDARWLEANPAADPILQPGQRLFLPARPSTVTVVLPSGVLCAVGHNALAYASDYLQRCDAQAQAQHAWVVQPDGRVQRWGIASWNEEAQEPPAPGAWIVVHDSRYPWSQETLQRLADFLATQGPAPDPGTGQPLPSPKLAPSATGLGETHTPPRGLDVSASNWGVTGLLQTPTARMQPAGTVSVTVSRTWPYTQLNINLQPFDWLEGTFRYTDIANRLYGPAIAGDQSMKDKSIDVKLRLLPESERWPQVALGIRDIGGTGLFAGEYLVASRRWGAWDFSLGLGWGYLGARGDIDNPLAFLDERFNTRPRADVGVGGEFNFNKLFRGRPALFAGVQYQTPWEPLTLKLELEGNDYRREPLNNPQPQSSPFNFGAVYRVSPALDLHLSWERGNTLGLGFTLRSDLGSLSVPKLADPQRLPVAAAAPLHEPDWRLVAQVLQAQTGWLVLDLERAGTELLVRFERVDAIYLHAPLERIAAVLHRFAPARVLVFRIQAQDRQLGRNEWVINRTRWVQSRTEYLPPQWRNSAEVTERMRHPGFVHPEQERLFGQLPQPWSSNIGLSYRQSLGGPDGFVLYQLGISGSLNWNIRPNTWFSGVANLGLVDNYDRFRFDAPSKLPRVRTDVRQYLTTSDLTFPLLQLTHVDRLGPDQFFSVYGGMLEPMYGGIGAEWLYRPWGSRIAFGVDVNAVRQRGFRQDLSFRDYQILTGHASLYWDTGFQDIVATVRAGRYLAGDRGFTLDLSRQFRNGVRIGAYFTRTNVPPEVFGEGSFDKGIYISLPFDAFLTRSSGQVAEIMWQPLLRDGGALLRRAYPLFELTRQQAGNALQFGPQIGPGGVQRQP